MSAANSGSDPTVSRGMLSIGELEAEMAKLRRGLAVEPMAKNVPNKGTGYFAREWLPGTRS